jgi:hypothetical protein
MKKTDKRFRVRGLKNGSYFCVEVQASREIKRGDGLIINAGDVYYYDLQYPSRGEAYQHLSYLIDSGDKILSITTSTRRDNTKPFLLPEYFARKYYTKVWHYKVFRKLGIITE